MVGKGDAADFDGGHAGAQAGHIERELVEPGPPAAQGVAQGIG